MARAARLAVALLAVHLPLASLFTPPPHAAPLPKTLGPARRPRCPPRPLPVLLPRRADTRVRMDGDESAYLGLEEGGRADLFPTRAEDALEQAADAVVRALDDGLYRVRVQLSLPELDPKQISLDQGSLMRFVNIVGGYLVDKGLRVNFVFNTVADASQASKLLREDLSEKISINVLGLGDFKESDNICILVCPCNAGRDLRRIEDVEKLIYAGPPKSMVSRIERRLFLERPIVLVNPSLEAIHTASTDVRKVTPMFLSDFTFAYFLDPRAMISRSCEAAIMMSYPSRWQLWMRSTGALNGRRRLFSASNEKSRFRLIWEKNQKLSLSDLAQVFDDVDDRLQRRGMYLSKMPRQRFRSQE